MCAAHVSVRGSVTEVCVASRASHDGQRPGGPLLRVAVPTKQTVGHEGRGDASGHVRGEYSLHESHPSRGSFQSPRGASPQASSGP